MDIFPITSMGFGSGLRYSKSPLHVLSIYILKGNQLIAWLIADFTFLKASVSLPSMEDSMAEVVKKEQARSPLLGRSNATITITGRTAQRGARHPLAKQPFTLQP